MKKALRAVICLAACTAVLSGCGKSTQYTASGLVMDTVFTVTVYGDKDMPAQLIELGNELDRSVLSRFSDDSLLSRYYEDVSGSITDSPGDPATGSNEIYEILKKCDEIRKDSNNLFDVHMGALSDLWNISGKARGETEPIVPEPEDILSAKEDRTILDLGAVGKGIYLDHAYELLKQSDVSCAVISAGGSVMTYGRKPDDTDFNVAIRNPFPDAENESYGTIVLRGTNFVSTSGSYERYFEKDGVRYHHILNPRSGYPVWCLEDIAPRSDIEPGRSFPVSVTVVSDSGFVSDALSTACFLMMPTDSQELLNKYNSGAVYIMSDGSVVTTGAIIYKESENKFYMDNKHYE